MKTLEQVRENFSHDVYASGTTGIYIQYARPGHCVVSLKPDARHFNALGQVMGAVYNTMADFAFAVASNYEFDGPVGVVTLDSNIRFLNPMKGTILMGAANVIRDGSRTCFYQAEITDDLGTKIASVSITGYKFIKKQPSPED